MDTTKKQNAIYTRHTKYFNGQILHYPTTHKILLFDAPYEFTIIFTRQSSDALAGIIHV